MITTLALCWLLLTPLGVDLPSAADPAVLAAADEPPVELKWKRASGEKDFEQGRQAYEAGEYKDAHSHFKAAEKNAGDRQTKREVRRWEHASVGALMLAAYRRRAEAGDLKGALSDAEKQVERYRETPVGSEFAKFIDDLAGKVYFILDNFEHETGRFSEKYGKSWESDPKLVKQGKYSLKWTTTGQDPELKIKDIPKDLTPYKSIAMWVYFPKKGPGYEMIFKGLGKSKDDYGTSLVNAFFHQQSGHSGWKRIEVDFKQFKPQGDVKWDNVRDFRIQFAGKRNVTLYVDDIVLVRK